MKMLRGGRGGRPRGGQTRGWCMWWSRRWLGWGCGMQWGGILGFRTDEIGVRAYSRDMLSTYTLRFLRFPCGADTLRSIVRRSVAALRFPASRNSVAQMQSKKPTAIDTPPNLRILPNNNIIPCFFEIYYWSIRKCRRSLHILRQHPGPTHYFVIPRYALSTLLGRYISSSSLPTACPTKRSLSLPTGSALGACRSSLSTRMR